MDLGRAPRTAAIGILIVLILFVLMSSYFLIEAGERGVVLRFGAVSRVVAEGIQVHHGTAGCLGAADGSQAARVYFHYFKAGQSCRIAGGQVEGAIRIGRRAVQKGRSVEQ